MKIASSTIAVPESVATDVVGPNQTPGPAIRFARWATRHLSVILAVVATAIVVCGQLAEDLADSAPLQMLPPTMAIQRWTIIALVAYVFGTSAAVDRTVQRALAAVRSVVKIDEADYSAYVTRMSRLPGRLDTVLLIASGLIAAILFGVLGSDLLLDDPITGQSQHLPTDPFAAGLILSAYTVVGWAVLRLVFGTARLAWFLFNLAREPLEISVFDTTRLIPFGNIALALAIVPAGVIVILIIGLGSPRTLLAWSVLVEATLASLLALLLPLLGIHRQMSRAKYAAMGQLSLRLTELYDDVSHALPREGPASSRLSNTTNTLIQMRKAVQEMTTWPFRDTVAFGRAVLIALAPLIYTTLSELIRVFWIGPLAR
jgi:hypothetical protein